MGNDPQEQVWTDDAQMNKLLPFGLPLLFVGCADVPPTPSQVASIGYGTPLTVDYRAVIKDWLDKTLKDPYSAVVEYGVAVARHETSALPFRIF